MLIRDSDLLKIENKNKYSIRDLRANVDHLNKKFLLHTQRLDEEFCIEYILDIRMDSGDEDSYLFCENYITKLTELYIAINEDYSARCF